MYVNQHHHYCVRCTITDKQNTVDKHVIHVLSKYTVHMYICLFMCKYN